MVTVVRPTPGEEVRSPIRVQGSASVVEGNVHVVVRNARDEAVGQGFTMASAGAPDRGEYNAAIPFTAASRQNGVVEVFSPSAQDGRPQHLVSIPVVLVQN